MLITRAFNAGMFRAATNDVKKQACIQAAGMEATQKVFAPFALPAEAEKKTEAEQYKELLTGLIEKLENQPQFQELIKITRQNIEQINTAWLNE